MALKVLGQSAPAAATNTDLYTVPSLKETVGSTLVLCNRSATPTTFRIAVRPTGAAIANQHYIAYDAPLVANEVIALTIGFSLAATDVVTVYATAATMSFSLFGEETTA